MGQADLAPLLAVQNKVASETSLYQSTPDRAQPYLLESLPTATSTPTDTYIAQRRAIAFGALLLCAGMSVGTYLYKLRNPYWRAAAYTVSALPGLFAVHHVWDTFATRYLDLDDPSCRAQVQARFADEKKLSHMVDYLHAHQIRTTQGEKRALCANDLARYHLLDRRATFQAAQRAEQYGRANQLAQAYEAAKDRYLEHGCEIDSAYAAAVAHIDLMQHAQVRQEQNTRAHLQTSRAYRARSWERTIDRNRDNFLGTASAFGNMVDFGITTRETYQSWRREQAVNAQADALKYPAARLKREIEAQCDAAFNPVVDAIDARFAAIN